MLDSPAVAWITGGAAVLVALAVIGRAALSLWRFGRGVNAFLSDWFGEQARPGQARRLGFPERLHALEVGQAEIRAELKPNGGSTLRDAVDRISPQLKE